MTSDISAGFLVNGRYEIVRSLGVGGFAVVYEARDRQIGRPVAIKVMNFTQFAPDEEARLELIERFSREARTAASIDHPNVAQIFDFGVVESHGDPFIVMELMKGRDLDRYIRKKGPLGPKRCLPLFVDCLEALGLAHAQGIVHKDLKPANLFLKSPGNKFERLCIIDFGVAHVEHEAQRRITKQGQVSGTASYMPPEYATEQIVTPALDVYQMGLILVEALVGEPVVDHPDDVSAMFMHVRGELRIPGPLLSSPLGTVIRRALKLEHPDRYETAAEMAEALAAIDPADIPENLSAATRQTIRGEGLSDEMLARETGEQRASAQRSDILEAQEATAPDAARTKLMHGASPEERIRVASEASATDHGSPAGAEIDAKADAEQVPEQDAAPTSTSDEAGPSPADIFMAQRTQGSTAETGLVMPSVVEEFTPTHRDQRPMAIVAALVAIMACVGVVTFFWSSSPSDAESTTAGSSDPDRAVIDHKASSSAAATVSAEPSAARADEADEAHQPDENAEAAETAAIADQRDDTEPKLRFVIVATQPSHATLFEGDRKLGTTPLDVEFFADEGERTFRVERTGYKPLTRSISAADAPRVDLRLQPQPRPKTKPKRPKKKQPPKPKQPKNPDSMPILLPD